MVLDYSEFFTVLLTSHVRALEHPMLITKDITYSLLLLLLLLLLLCILITSHKGFLK